MERGWAASIPPEMRRPGANEIDIERSQRQLGRKLPKDFVEFIRESNGAEGYLKPGMYFNVFRIEDLPEMNEAAAIEEFAPGLLIFASDGQGTSYAFNFATPQIRVVVVSDEEMSREKALVVADSFTNFVNNISC